MIQIIFWQKWEAAKTNIAQNYWPFQEHKPKWPYQEQSCLHVWLVQPDLVGLYLVQPVETEFKTL